LESTDSADFFKDPTHVLAGVKISDPNGIQKLLFLRDDAWDRKDYEYIFKGFYEWVSEIELIGLQLQRVNQIYVHLLLLTPLTSKPLGILATEEVVSKIRMYSAHFTHLCSTH
jgi:hypothetical protein